MKSTVTVTLLLVATAVLAGCASLTSTTASSKDLPVTSPNSTIPSTTTSPPFHNATLAANSMLSSLWLPSLQNSSLPLTNSTEVRGSRGFDKKGGGGGFGGFGGGGFGGGYGYPPPPPVYYAPPPPPPPVYPYPAYPYPYPYPPYYG